VKSEYGNRQNETGELHFPNKDKKHFEDKHSERKKSHRVKVVHRSDVLNCRFKNKLYSFTATLSFVKIKCKLSAQKLIFFSKRFLKKY